MKIYFSGSIRGGQQDTDLYHELIKALKQYGTVLTEHIGSKKIDTNSSDQEIHDRDMKWVRESDIVIAEVTVPSLGVGYEIGRAIHLKKPIICLYRSINGKTTSAMIRGCSDLQCFEYAELNDAKTILKKFFTGNQ
ncbi:nucleoside 2-deoxyribosyltransferase [Labilibaculum sp.]|uniref:nucleoside 2-deoxyribosyltransferase n=1 Tax=Labilibaculum sp. TaxID=2060723 RepID=UPI0035634E64